MNTSTLAIKVSGISKSYGSVKALDNISLDVRRGEIFGLIGPDGAGKTTLFKILVTLLNADSGLAQVEDNIRFKGGRRRGTGCRLPLQPRNHQTLGAQGNRVR